MIKKTAKHFKDTKSIRIILKSYDPGVLDHSVKNIINVAKETGSSIVGPIPMPSKAKKITILASPHVDSESRDQLKQTIHKRLIIIYYTKGKTLEALKLLILPSGIEIKIKMFS